MKRLGRRRFLTYLVAAPTLSLATNVGLDAVAPSSAEAAIPTLPAPADLVDLGDVLILASAPTANMLVLEIGEDGIVDFRLPREEVGQGLTTAVAMLVAEELDVPLARVRIRLDDARPELLFNQLTGSSNSIRSLYDPVRHTAALARARMVAAAARQWGVQAGVLTVRQGVVTAPDGRTASYGSLSAAAASPDLGALTATPKPESQHTLVGTPTSRIDARAIITGRQEYTLDLEVPGAKPCMVRRPPTINGTVKSVNNTPAVRAMPGVLDVVTVPTGVAVVAETFGQALDAKDALDVTWGPGSVDALSDAEISAKLRAATAPLVVPGLLVKRVDAEFDFAFAGHAPLETNSAVADVRSDRAEIWSGLKSPIVARQTIAKELGLPLDKVTVHVVQAGGSFGRRLFFDAALEAALVSQKSGRPVRLQWSRIDDMRHGRMRPATHHRIRATYALGQVLSFEHRVAAVETDFRHGLGEILTATAASLPSGVGNAGFAQTLFLTTVKSPYNFGLTTQVLTEVPLKMHTGSWRSVYSGNTRGAEEIVVDELAAELGKDPVAFRRAFLKNDRQRAVLDKAAAEGGWGRTLPKGWAQGVGFHEEYKSCTACLVEIDATDPKKPRVTRAVIAADVGRPINPRGLEAQLLGGLTDAISTTLRAGLHIDKGLPLEGSYSQFHYARQKDSPKDVKIFIMPASGEPGGAGELGVPAAVGAVANAYARATGTKPRTFPVNFDVDFTPFPR
ncbi:molybdopterin cofactor-binding domain-containing protein [Streptomyces turgidiscabies]|uniref:Aldehyde oxidase and xanthine dehydrogenase, molybdopterin binding domain protein n=1 Tax=Streptomyces turgidiscabies (strain Car8) TaxID=698760 RepID=L7F6Y0_STRT8|nr:MULTISPECIES: molybdopterin cofactor-binding domain-containing protein [Streptomyces]ELP66869.1 aldehyde oxidase and xanthine dehydrogenase, molybdopterin binding domain protein [Streptomyces turgidiscabies Car8]MDX3491970.1 molybdopterin-dependent oxidoreductase [Streptomyces turgidiscabies]GAQ71913.1 isoquinoline 1-oxidoreductase subunit beta [Streptomyces turgidiscabies]